MHDVSDVVNLDDFIEYTVMNHDAGMNENVDDKVNADDGGDTLLAYMAGRTSSAGDIRQVLAANSIPNKNYKSRKANESVSAPLTLSSTFSFIPTS